MDETSGTSGTGTVGSESGRRHCPTRGSKPGEKRGGRAKGVPNKLTSDLRAMILGALADAGGQTYLAKQAVAAPGAFLALLSKILPSQVTGPNDSPLFAESDDKLRARLAELLAKNPGILPGTTTD